MDGGGTRPAIAGPTLLCLGGALIVIAAGFFTFAFNEWLRVGLWPAYPLSRMLAELHIPYPRLGWAGAQSALDWFLAIGACTILFWAGAAVALLGGLMVAKHEKKQGPNRISA